VDRMAEVLITPEVLRNVAEAYYRKPDRLECSAGLCHALDELQGVNYGTTETFLKKVTMSRDWKRHAIYLRGDWEQKALFLLLLAEWMELDPEYFK